MDSNNNSANMKLEPGMMCLVIGFRSSPVNLGKIITLSEHVLEGSLNPSGNKYKVSGWLCYGEGLVSVASGGREVCGKRGLFASKHLMPIRPEEDPLEITDVITKKEKA